jgi:8-oxo-dGTP diphosphatase
MNTKRFTLIAAVLILLKKDNKVFLIKRKNTGFDDEKYAIPGGHLEGNETARSAAIREAYEELGVKIHLDDLQFLNVTHLVTNSERIHFTFLVEKWVGTPKNNEVAKASAAGWYSLEKLPVNLNDVSKHLFHAYTNALPYAELGWIAS